MSCPTCNHTMHVLLPMIEEFHRHCICPRCGTLTRDKFQDGAWQRMATQYPGEPQVSTPTIYTDFPQYSPEFWEHRRGRPSTSNFDKILTPAKGEPSKSQEAYIAELISEIHQFDPPFMTEKKASAAMDEGTRREEESRRWYAMETDTDVLQVGGVLSACGRFWSSPDGLIGNNGVLELKNPLGKTHVEYLMSGGGLPTEYKCQVHGQLIVTGRAWVDFVSYVPGEVRKLRVRVQPDTFTDKLRAELEKFWVKFQNALALVAPALVAPEGGSI